LNVERALSCVADAPIKVVCAGRTDAGVHARCQVVHFDTTAVRSSRAWVLGTNSELPADISLRWAMRMPEHFHARYSAERRTYRYLILNRGSRSALAATKAAVVFHPLDVENMRAAAKPLIGYWDFNAFRSLACQARSSRRELTQLSVEANGELIAIQVTANSFLHHMVRNLVGLLIDAGLGKVDAARARAILESGQRKLAPPTAPAHGLYLWQAHYPAPFDLPADRSVMIAPWL
jgi:tRNA pseudouridine38-40 synthase